LISYMISKMININKTYHINDIISENIKIIYYTR
jgi:hypothetical protein